MEPKREQAFSLQMLFNATHFCLDLTIYVIITAVVVQTHVPFITQFLLFKPSQDK